MLEREEQALDHVVDVAPGTDLRAVAVDLEVAPSERRFDERADRAAADLAGPEDVEGSNRDRGHPELGVVGVGHVLARELRDRVRPAGLADRADGRDLRLLHVECVLAEHLAGRELDEALERVAGCDSGLERVVGADHVDAHRADGAGEDRVDACDSRRMDEMRAPVGELDQPRQVEHVAFDETEVRVPREVGARERVAVEVVDRDDIVRLDELLGERGTDEPGAARDQHALPRQ